jgi:signal transduction histidine kinase
MPMPVCVGCPETSPISKRPFRRFVALFEMGNELAPWSLGCELSSKRTPTETELVDLNDVIREVLAIVHCEAERNRISLRTDLAGDLPRVLGDRIELHQAIWNLLVNAIQALSEMSEGTRELYLSSRQGSQIHAERSEDKGEGLSKPEEILIEVRDSGPGLDLKDFNQLFEAFYTTKPQGLGIGLTISRTIVEAHGGRLWAKPNEPRGAVFHLSLPVRS